MKKRMISVLLTLVMLVGVFSAPAMAAFVREGTCGDNIAWVLDGNDYSLTYTGTGRMGPHNMDADIFMDLASRNVKTLTFSDGITSLYNHLIDYSKITSVMIPDGVKSIGSSTFSGCESLIDITIPDSVEYIGSGAFSHTPWLEAQKEKQGDMVIINNILYCYTGTESSVTIPDGITAITSCAFEGCAELEEIIIPDSVEYIGTNAFEGTKWLEIQEAEQGDMLFAGKVLYQYTGDSDTLVVPEGTKGIAGEACRSVQLWDVTLPEGLVTIGEHAFPNYNGEGDNYLYPITIPESVEYIGWMAVKATEITVLSKDAFIEINALHALKTVYGYEGSTAEVEVNRYLAEYPEASVKFVVLEDEKTENPFTDVAEGWYYEPVLWAVEKGITTGTSDTTFSPDNTCTRAEAVTFLWRAMGKPEPKAAACPFVDVKEDAWYYDAMMWAYETSVTTGTDNTHFSPTMTLSRSQFVTLLWRAAGSEVVQAENPFKDVKATDWFCNAVVWANKAGVTTGTGNGVFSPEDTCSRSQVVTMLHRYLAK